MSEHTAEKGLLPTGTVECERADHPAKVHGHYGYGGRYSCSDLGSPLLSEENMGHYRGGYLVLFAKRVTPPGSGDAESGESQ